jgi:hypothetical protein
VIFVEGVILGLVVAAVIIPEATSVAVTVADTVVGRTVAGSGVVITGGTSVGESVTGVVAGVAGTGVCVHPLAAASRITRMKRTIPFFMKCD